MISEDICPKFHFGIQGSGVQWDTVECKMKTFIFSLGLMVQEGVCFGFCSQKVEEQRTDSLYS